MHSTDPRPPATLIDLRTEHLLRAARPLQVRHSADAAGRCFALSLELALLAQTRLGAELQLVKW